jgi:hypothetical protein
MAIPPFFNFNESDVEWYGIVVGGEMEADYWPIPHTGLGSTCKQPVL